MLEKINFATKLTIFRIMIIPLYLLVYFIDMPFFNWLAWAIFSIASITDFFDGYIARKYNQNSRLGALLDPIADKLLIMVVLVSLLTKHSQGLEGIFIMICTVIIIGRELMISALREFMAKLNIHNAVEVKYIGKLKTTVQIFSLGFLIVYDKTWFIPTKQIGWLLLFIATLLTIWSMIDYFKSAFNSLVKNDIDVSL